MLPVSLNFTPNPGYLIGFDALLADVEDDVITVDRFYNDRGSRNTLPKPPEPGPSVGTHSVKPVWSFVPLQSDMVEEDENMDQTIAEEATVPTNQTVRSSPEHFPIESVIDANSSRVQPHGVVSEEKEKSSMKKTVDAKPGG
ncbi:unnamed protein product [Calicophoron daubneyi]|uniref:Uncharacterized protein n=1 Tax=Calicophoron daubneyi TaxID=300641 RepID=A0AAV2T241_CALDB